MDRIPNNRACVVLCLCFSLLIASARGQVKPPDEAEVKKPAPQATRPAPAKGANLNKLLVQFRQNRDKPDKRREIADKILALGKQATEKLLSAIKTELARADSLYRKAFYRRAQQVVRAKRKTAKPKAVRAWRERVNSMQRHKKLTESTLMTEADPAMESLRSALTASAAEVLESSKVLPEQRKKLLELAELYQHCEEAQKPDEADKPRSEKPKAPQPPWSGDFPKKLKRAEKSLALLATPLSARNQGIVNSNWNLKKKMLPEEAAAMLELNIIRSLLGLKALKADLKLCSAARGHSKDMHERDFIAHESPVKGKATYRDRARLAGTTAHGECIAAGSATGSAALSDWFFSPQHHRIMLGKYSRVGLGRHKDKWTLMVGR